MKADRVTDKTMLERLYVSHHHRGRKRGRAVLEHERAAVFRSWVGRGKEVLDLGCRDGSVTRHFVDGNRVVGGDIDSGALRDAQEAHGIETSHVNLNGPLPFPDQAFDVVVLAETLEHLPYPGITLGEVKRLLRPSGLFIGNVPVCYSLAGRLRVLLGKRIDSDPTHLQYFSCSSLRRLLEEFFSLEEMIPVRGRLARWSMRLFARNVAFRCRRP